MHKKALLACLLAVALLLSGCALIEKDMTVDRATEVIRVGDTVYTKGEVQDQVDYQLAYMSYLYSMFGMSYDPTDAQNIADARESVVNYLVEDAVKNQKVQELGLDQLTAEEQAELDEKIEEAWQSNLDSVKSTYFADTELEGDELTAALEAKADELGLTRDAVAVDQTTAFNQEKLRAFVVKDVAVSDEEIQASFDTKVEEAKTSYETDLSAYGSSVNSGSTVYYRPAGYRMVKQILIKFHEDDQTVIDGLNTKLSAQNSSVSTLTTSLTNAGVADADALAAQVTATVTPAQGEGDPTVTSTAAFTEEQSEEVADLATQLAEAKALQAYYEAELAAAKAKAFANIDEETDAVLAQLAEGADWDALMAEKTQDPGMQEGRDTAKTGYAVCENFSSFDTAFTAAAMALEKVGDVSPKTEGVYGYYIIQYTSDVQEGPVDLADVHDELHDSLLTDKQNTTFDETLAQWVEAANAKIDYSEMAK